MRENYDQIMDWLAVYEGGKVDDPDDPGGRTNRGVTQRVYGAYRRANGLPGADVWNMTDDEHDDIYLEQYWRPIWGDRLPSGVDASMFDWAVHGGVSRSVKTAQKITGVAQDGVMGNVTMTSILDYLERHGAVQFLTRFNDARLAYLQSRGHWWKYKNGWTRRVVGDEPGAQDHDFGVVDRSIMLSGTKRDIPAPKSAAPGKASDEDRPNLLQLLVSLITSLIRRKQ